ncbi:MAG: amino acid adenylation domain-containing protein, partial [Chloroflexi bacterium]|nr:amino acid adenylation domain-containing protein [Chloroflexota bacterium]
MNKADVVDIYRLSPIQQGILFHSLYSPETAVYFDQFVWHLTMPIDVPAFVQAWQRMVDHHPILRTSFFWEDLDEPLQVVSRQVEVPFTLLDWRDVPADQQAARFADYLARDREGGVNFAEPPLTRLALFHTGDDEYRFVWSYHHILLDGWSISLLLTQALKLYDALRNGQSPPLKRARPYRDYITWLRGQGLEQAESFWRSTLRGFTSATPLDSFATDAHLTNAAPDLTEQRLVFSPETTAQLQQLARQQRITLSTMLQAAWALLLSRYSGEEDIVYGMTVSGRSPKLAGSEGMIGVFINTLPVRVRVTQNTPLIAWLEQLQQQLIELAQYESTPLLDIQQWSEVPRGQPLFESIVVFENFPFESAERNRSLHFVRRTNYALTIVGEARPNLVVDIAYDRRRFDAALIERMQQHLRLVLETMLHQLEQPLGQIVSLTPDEQQQLAAWNNTITDYSLDRCLHELVEAQAARTPDAPALVFGDQTLSYAELNRRANQLAHYLQALGIQPELPIGLCVERSPELMIGLLAILKSGGVYVPLDPAYPQDRLGFMLADAQIHVLLTTSRLCERLPESAARIVCLDDEWPTVAEQPAENLRGIHPDNLAYIMYTSGSTGRPKGVQNSHRAIANRLLWSQEQYPLSPADRVLQIASFSFDIALWELIGPLLAGAQVILARPGGQQESGYLVRLMAEQQVTVAHFVPSLLQVLLTEPDLQRCDKLRLVFCGGEALPSDLPGRFFARLPVELVQFYGPTEASINATAWHFDRSTPQAGVPIGRPIANTQVHLLDRHLRPVPIGVAGEIYIGGVGVARGYLNRPDQTAERFVPDPFAQTGHPQGGARLYKTGDRGRFLPDGVLQFLGRTDQQIKIRGFRVELGEIEAVLRQHPAVAAAVVVARQDTADLRLVAYVVEEQGNKETKEQKSQESTAIPPRLPQRERGLGSEGLPSNLRAFLADRLPEYMIPAAFVTLDALPLTPTGKIDRRALPAPERLRDEAEAGAAEPSTPTEQMLTGIWSSILGVEQVGRFDHFFELGGHSLKATQVITRIRDAFEVELPLRVLFESPTVAELAARIDAARSAALADNVPPLVPLPRDRPMPLSFAQQRLWFLDQLVPGNPFYNMLSAIQLTGRLNQAALSQALGQVVRRHEALRTTFVATDGQPMQVIAPDLVIPLPVIDCATLPEAERAEQVRQFAVAEAQKPFDLQRGPLLRVSLIRLSDDQHVLLLAMHHIVSDGWSMGILIDELARAYSGCIEDAEHHAPLAPLPVQYADFAVWQRAWLAPDTPGAVLEQQLAYWKQHLGGDLPVLDLPTDHPRPLVQSFRGATQRFLFPKALHEGLVSLSQREGATLFMTLLAAWQTLLFRYSGQDDILTSSPIANRTRREIEGLIGFFVNTLVLRTDLSGN